MTGMDGWMYLVILVPYCFQKLQVNDTFMFNAKLKYIGSTSSYHIPKVSNSLDPDQARHSQTG